MSLYCFTVFSVLEEHLDLFPSASWRGGDARLIWLQSGMWLCLYCSCSCSPRGTVIWRWERAVTCGNGLWRSNNYPFPLCHKERGRNDMLRHRSGQKKNSEVSREQLDCGWNWKLECEGGREGKKKGCEVKERDGWLKSDSSGGQARSYGSRFFGPAVLGEESTSSSAAFHPHTCLKSALDTSAEFKPANMLASFVLSEVRRRR